ncbi:MAG: SDR family oxidoreductase [Lachnospiraceae bacterium]|nr:SDR family oxidoreductase [Lachnospiraceae bacterium]
MEKNAIITGTNRGLGKEFVKQFAENGYNVWACAREKSEKFEEYLKELSEKNSVWVKPVYFDLAKEEEIKDKLGGLLKEKHSVDVLINNAGTAYGGLFTMTPVKVMREVYEVNVFSQVAVMQMVARKMMRQKSGNIINLCSVGGIETEPGYLAYGSSKAALIWITKCLSKELGQYNIRVNGIAPGLVHTDMGHYKPENEIEKTIARTSLGRMGDAKEIGSAALYMASEEAGFMTGHILVMDGGRV